MSSPVITLERLAKNYGPVRALDGVSVRMPRGPVGLLGPNGAGKTTLLKLLLGQLAPDQGKASIAGYDPTRRGHRLALRHIVGYMPESSCLIPRMNGVETVVALGRLSGLRYRDAMKRAHEVLDYVELDEQRYRETDNYSAGMKQRLKLAQALVHDPKLLLLDEPTNGLDPRGRKHMLDLIHDLGHRQNKDILLCSHLLPDVERTCRDVLVINRGSVITSGAIAGMTRSDGAWVRLELAQASHGFAAGLGRLGWQYETESPTRYRVHMTDGREDGDALFALASQNDASVVALTAVRASLEDVFLKALREAEQKVG